MAPERSSKWRKEGYERRLKYYFNFSGEVLAFLFSKHIFFPITQVLLFTCCFIFFYFLFFLPICLKRKADFICNSFIMASNSDYKLFIFNRWKFWRGVILIEGLPTDMYALLSGLQCPERKSIPFCPTNSI